MTVSNLQKIDHGTNRQTATKPPIEEQDSSGSAYLELLKDCLTASIYDESSWRVLEPTGNWLRRLIIRRFAKRKLLIVRGETFDPVKRENGADWPMFSYTMIGRKRLNNIEFCVRDVVKRGVPGDIVETGAWRGGCCIFTRALLKELHDSRTVWVCDSFEGMPAPKDERDEVDLSSMRYLRASIEQVQNNFRRFGLLDAQVQFLKGWFCDTLPSAPIDKIAVLRMDGDLYHSTMDALNNLYHKVTPSGYVIVDDYGSWPECRRAVHDFLNSKRISVNIIAIDQDSVYWKV